MERHTERQQEIANNILNRIKSPHDEIKGFHCDFKNDDEKCRTQCDGCAHNHHQPAYIPTVKLTKSALNRFVVWSNTKYNDWLGYGTKKENVEIVYQALKDGHHKGNEVFKIQCAQPVGENPHRGNVRNWRTKTSGGTYIIDCKLKTIKSEYYQQILKFHL